MPKAKPDLTSVRSLITSVSPLARHVKLTPTAIYRWFQVNRIPGAHIIKVANFYDVDVGELIHLTGSELSAAPNVSIKSRDVLPALIEVRAGRMTLADAVEKTGQTEVSLKLVMIHWGEQLGDLYETLEALDKKGITLDQACERLGLAKFTIHGLRRKYGYAPGKLKRVRPLPTLGRRRTLMTQAAMDVIAGLESAASAAEKYKVSARNVFRYVERLCPLSVTELSRFPQTFRWAYAEEIEKNTPKYVEKWLKIADETLLYVQKQTKYPKTPETWKTAPLKRLLVGVLLGEGTLGEIAAARGGEPVVLEGLFTSELRALDLTWPEVAQMGLNHQTALAELLIWQMDRKRRFVEGPAGDTA